MAGESRGGRGWIVPPEIITVSSMKNGLNRDENLDVLNFCFKIRHAHLEASSHWEPQLLRGLSWEAAAGRSGRWGGSEAARAPAGPSPSHREKHRYSPLAPLVCAAHWLPRWGKKFHPMACKTLLLSILKFRIFTFVMISTLNWSFWNMLQQLPPYPAALTKPSQLP